MLDNRRECDQNRQVAGAFPREWIDTKGLAFHKLNVATAIVFWV